MKTIKNSVTIAAIVVVGNVGTISAQEIKDYENRVIVNREIGSAIPFGKESSLLVENFKTLETGSDESPSKINNSDLPGWEIKNVYSVGGKIYLPSSESKITTPEFPKLKAGENVWFRFKAKSEKPNGGKLFIKIEGTGKDIEFVKGDVTISTPVKDNWDEYYSFFYDGTVDSKISIYLDNESSPIYIDDIEIFTVDQYVSTPKMLPHSNYDGKSFIAHWTKPDGAVGYRINVFTVDSKFTEDENYTTSNIKNYLVKDRFTNNNFFLVEDIDPNENYYYTVTAYNDTTYSILSKRIGVVDVVSPKIEETSTNGKSIRFKWSPVKGATAYEYSILRKKIFEKDEEVVVSEENMDDLVFPHQVSRAEYGDLLVRYASNEILDVFTYYFIRRNKEEYFDTYYNGWKAAYCTIYKEGYLGLNNVDFIEKQTGEVAKIISPELDLSKDDGKFSLSVKLQSANGLSTRDSRTDFRTQARFILKNYNESTCRYEISEIVYTKDVEDYWKTFEVDFSKGTNKSIVEIEVIDSIGVNLYVDDIKITQYYKKGDTAYLLLRESITKSNEGLMLVFDTVSDTAEYIQKVSSIKRVNAEDYYLIGKELVTSGSCEASAGTVTNSINNLQQPEFSVEVKNNTVYISNTGTYKVSVFTLDGKSVYSGVNKDTHCINLPSNTYIIHVGNKSMKLVF